VESGGEDDGCGWTAKGKETMEHEDYTPPIELDFVFSLVSLKFEHRLHFVCLVFRVVLSWQ
jgi:hypothetical protein